MKRQILLFSSVAVIGAVLAGAPASAQEASASQQSEAVYTGNVITVTARKRDETDLDVPIAIRALGSEQLAKQGIQSLQDVAATTPSLTIASAGGNSGGTITLRGIGTPPAGPGTDQAVALNFDGVTVAEGLSVRLGQFDMERVEILQGPQSLYYGKNSSGGIISMVSADPTDEPYLMLRAGYGFEAREILTEAVISGPIADGLGARLALYRSDMEGYFKNPLASKFDEGTPSAAQLAVFGPIPRAAYRRAPEGKVEAIRGTLKFETDTLTIRTKGTWLKQTGADSYSTTQFFGCPGGTIGLGNLSQVAGISDCELNEYGPAIGRNTDSVSGNDPLYRDGQPYSEVEQLLLVGNIDYEVGDGILLSSVTGYYDVDLAAGEIVTAGVYPSLGSTLSLARKEFQQEFRVSTDLDSPINGMAGVYFQDHDFTSTVSANSPLVPDLIPLNGNFPTPIYYQTGKTYAVFGQVTVDITDQFQIAAGGRYTDEKKDLRVDFLGTFVEDLFNSKATRSKKFSPEITASYKPNSDTNIFVTYKKGTKSGGFNLSALLPGAFPNLPEPYKNDFEDENAEGVEGGIKTLLLNGQLRFDMTAYRYTYDNLQVTVYDPVSAVTGTDNAAAARIYGVQLNTNFAPRSVPGLNVGLSVNYGHARYTEYVATCYVGQTIAEGCNLSFDPGLNAFTAQDLSGTQPTAAPDWSGNFNASYDFPITSGDTRIGLFASATYQDEFNVIYSQTPGTRQSSSVNVDATLRLFNDDSGWEFALIGKNLTDSLRIRWGVEAPFTGDATRTGTNLTGGRADHFGTPNAPRTIMARITTKFGGY